MDPTLPPSARRTLEALARIVVPQAFGATPAASDVMRLLEERIAGVPPHLRRGLLRALDALGNPVLRLLVSRRLQPWGAMPEAERAAAFARWGVSAFGPARTAHEAIRRLVLATYYVSPGAHHDIGVLPPLHTRKPIVSWEGPLEAAPAGEGVVARASRQASVPNAMPIRTPPPRAVSSGSTLRGTFRLTADVVVIGSGAGGSLVASRLAAAGREVLVVEAGPWLTGPDFTEDEASLFPRLYADAGLRATEDLSIGIVQGGAVGGGTTVNWMIMLRTPEHVLAEWRQRFGLDHLTDERMAAAFRTIEADLLVGEVPDQAHSPANRALLDGAAKLGWHARSARINAHGCVRAGSCSLGCRYGAKQSALEVYLPRAFAHGARLLAETRVQRLERMERDTGSGTPPRTRVHAYTVDPVSQARVGEVTIDAPHVIVAAGAVETPAILQRSGFGGGGVGRFLRLHPTAAVMGEYAHDIYPLAGIPLSSICDEFAASGPEGYGYWIECPGLLATIFAAATPGFGESHREHMVALYRTAPFIALTRDGADVPLSNGSVSVTRRGYPRIAYELGPRDRENVRKSVEAAARIHLAAGATQVRTLHMVPTTVRSEADLARLRDANYGPHDMQLFSAHVNGTCRMGTDPATSGVGPDGQRFGVRGVYVADGSLLPTAPGVNPQETVMAMASIVADQLIG